MLRAVPAIILIADSTDAAFKSGIFNVAISLNCSVVTLATLVLLGTLDPDSIPATFFNRTAAGGVLVINE